MKYTVHFSTPSYVSIEAESLDEARELFLSGEFSSSDVRPDWDSIFDENDILDIQEETTRDDPSLTCS